MSFFTRLKDGLKKTSDKLTNSLSQILTHKKLDQDTLDAFEETLIQSDMGASTAAEITQKLKTAKFNQDVTTVDIRSFLGDEIRGRLEKAIQPLSVNSSYSPHVIMMMGVNGSGKTTTIAKLSHQFKDQGLRVMVAACDTFRAAATEQLETWAQRLAIPIIKAPPGSDAAGLAFEALTRAKKEGVDVLLIDTAGRLHTNHSLMEEMAKIARVVKKIDPSSPHSTVLVLDATTGQNALNQVRDFNAKIPLTGLIMTKLDGSSKGGMLVQLATVCNIPIHAIGVGEDVDDLKPFDAHMFATSLVGL